MLSLLMCLSIALGGGAAAAKKKVKEKIKPPPAQTWPVRAVSVSISTGGPWTPNQIRVPEGSEVVLTMKNSSTAPACFEIGHTEKGKWVLSRQCVDVGGERKVTFFANVAKGTYPIRNAWEQQGPGEFIVE